MAFNGLFAIVTRHALAWTVWIIGLDWRVPFVRPALLAGDVGAAVDVPDLPHLIPQNDLLPIPRRGRNTHFSARLELDNDRRLVAGREFFENFFGRVCSHKSFRPDYRYRLHSGELIPIIARVASACQRPPVIASPNRKYPPEPDALALAALVVESLDELTPDAIESGAQRARKQRTSG
jgi:hypothetical protein